jgi:GTP-binding protein YchF
MLRIGIIGPQGCGKTSLFKALAPAASAAVGSSQKREIHIGQAKVPDPRLDELFRVFQKSKQVNATIEYVDVVGYKRGEAAKSGYDPQLLAEIRNCDALLHVLRNFEFPGLPDPDPVAGYKIDFEEFLISDQIIVENRMERLQKDYQKNPQPEFASEIKLMERCQGALSEEKPIRTLELSSGERKMLRTYQLLSAKPELVVVNVSEEDVGKVDDIVEKFRSYIEGPGVELSAACASIEMEIAELDSESAREFMDDLGIKESALHRLIRASYKLLGLISFFTVGKDECRAWTIRDGTPAREAAGAVHTDMERGFIRAEVVNFADFQPRGSFAACRKDGVRRLEGKDYVVQDGDIIEFRFGV